MTNDQMNQNLDQMIDDSEAMAVASMLSNLKISNLCLSRFTASYDLLERIKTEGLTEDLKSIIIEANTKRVWFEDIIEQRKRAVLMAEKLKSGLDNFYKDFDENKANRRLFLLFGESGTGKTTTTELRYIDKIISNDVVFISCDPLLDAEKMLYSIDFEEKGLTKRNTSFRMAIEEGKKVILDEINTLPFDSLFLIQALTDSKKTFERGGDKCKIHPNFAILGTLNPPSDSDSRNSLGDALLGRAVNFILRLTKKEIAERLNVPLEFIQRTDDLWSYLNNAGFMDLRKLNYRSYETLWVFNFEEQIEGMICDKRIENLWSFDSIKELGEYQKMIDEINKIKLREDGE